MTIEIMTAAPEGRSILRAACELVPRDGGIRIRYLQEGDECTIEADASGLFMARTGTFPLRARFCKGVRTEFCFLDPLLGGTIPVFTSGYTFCETPLCIELTYDFAENTDLRHFFVQIFVSSEDP